MSDGNRIPTHVSDIGSRSASYRKTQEPSWLKHLKIERPRGYIHNKHYTPPEEVLHIWRKQYGAREALGKIFEIDIPETIPDKYVEQIVDHFANGSLHLPWELTTWWSPRHLPPNYEKPPVLGIVPETFDMKQPAKPFGWLLSHPSELTEDEIALASVGAEMQQSHPTHYEKYGQYFEYHIGPGGWHPPILLGVLADEDIGLLFYNELINSLEALESFWMAYLDYDEYLDWKRRNPGVAAYFDHPSQSIKKGVASLPSFEFIYESNLKATRAFFSEFDDMGSPEPVWKKRCAEYGRER